MGAGRPTAKSIEFCQVQLCLQCFLGYVAGFLSHGIFFSGNYVLGAFILGDLYPGELLSRGIMYRGIFYRGNFCPGVFLPRGILVGEFCTRDFYPDDFHQETIKLKAINVGNKISFTPSRQLTWSLTSGLLSRTPSIWTRKIWFGESQRLLSPDTSGISRWLPTIHATRSFSIKYSLYKTFFHTFCIYSLIFEQRI